jgi:hypothetical protein
MPVMRNGFLTEHIIEYFYRGLSPTITRAMELLLNKPDLKIQSDNICLSLFYHKVRYNLTASAPTSLLNPCDW